MVDDGLQQHHEKMTEQVREDFDQDSFCRMFWEQQLHAVLFHVRVHVRQPLTRAQLQTANIHVMQV
jgi:hypothetical protein